MRTATGKGSSARARTGPAISIIATRPSSARLLAVRPVQLSRIKPAPYFVFEQAAGNQGLRPQFVRRRPVFGKQLGQSDGAVEVDHRSSRSRSSSRISWSKLMTGLRAGGSLSGRAGGVIQPWRTASANKASPRSRPRPARGGTISATTRSRSVTKTVSPLAAKRTYSLSLFFNTFNPTARMR